jgi:hypothetical protein
MLWLNCEMTTLFYVGSAEEKYPCVVKIEESSILVEYVTPTQMTIQYTGKDMGNGHFTLEAPSVNGSASLHRFPDSQYLEGSWIESGQKGMWKIVLK